MYSFAKYKRHYAANLRLALPIVVAQLGQILVQLADNIMVGQWGGDNPVPLAAVAFGSSIALLFFLFGIGIAMGITPLVGELYGSGNRQRASVYLFNGIGLYTLIGIIIMLLQLAFAPLLYYMGQPVEVVDEAMDYYNVMAYSLPFVMFFCTFKQFLEGVGNTWISMLILLGANLLNILLNWVFIYGNWGVSPMGVTGAGVATFLSRAITPFVVLAVFLLVNKLRTYLQGWQVRMVSWSDCRSLLWMGFPIAMQMFLEAFAFVFTGVMMGWFGTVAIGANQITMTLGNCVFMIVTALGAATTIRVSHCYGARNWQELTLASKAALHMVLVWNMGAAFCFVLFRKLLPLLFTTNAEICELASVLLCCAAAYQFFDGVQNVSIGIMRGLQDVKIIPLISFIAYILLNLPVGWLLAFPLGIGPAGLVLSYVVGLSCTAILCLARIRKNVRQLRTIS
ncbi:MAG: MATE family efflux transporter [Paludibacter sp.]|nr:MATE family efflux transporter [Bacteroidales bacterium]MCM1069325.1 MATE family efflux transporter [Prevotella sp.]MCM1353845.1 MATE family efflux transporter [Bacteroides sp.]MCM1442905.1 MATE family efflux transporter [Muribaculum sp.]MCM1481950.1 MATE family efflux transporter [Paludibacter sp.]